MIDPIIVLWKPGGDGSHGHQPGAAKSRRGAARTTPTSTKKTRARCARCVLRLLRTHALRSARRTLCAACASPMHASECLCVCVVCTFQDDDDDQPPGLAFRSTTTGRHARHRPAVADGAGDHGAHARRLHPQHPGRWAQAEGETQRDGERETEGGAGC